MSEREQRPLAAFFDLFERVGETRVARATFDETLDDGARRVLEAARVVIAARDAETLPCMNGGDCVRQVRAADESDKGVRRLVAICGKSPPECDPADVSAREVATARIDGAALIGVVGRTLDVSASARASRATSASRQPCCIGVQERSTKSGGERDVFFAARPEREIDGAWLALRERAPRPAMVVVPTLRRIDAELVARHGEGDRVEVVALEDALGIEGDAIVRRRVAKLRVVKAAMGIEPVKTDASTAPIVAAAPARSLRDHARRPAQKKRETLTKTRDLDLPPIGAWRELGICLIEPDTVRLEGGGKYLTCTALDLGFASTKGNRRLLRDWEIVVRTCEGRGLFEWTKFDRRWDVARKYVSNVGIALQRMFGIAEPPYEEPGDGVYRAKFRAWERE